MHDVVHVLLGYGTTIPDEVAIKWFELIQTGLPLPALAVLVSPLVLMRRQEGS